MTTRDLELEPYEYQPLPTANTIRILCLEPAEAAIDPLRGFLLNFDRYEELSKSDHPQKYTAVSYTWGAPEFSERLVLNGPANELGYYLKITTRVRVMLEHFRKRHKRLYLWIDAICLNQSDDAEKAQHIPLMGEIYHQAHKSYFWLGLEDGFEAAIVFTYFRLLAITDSTPSATSMETNSTDQIQRFLKLAWFFRRWILQEAGLSRHGIMWCGHHRMQYDLFVSACRKLSAKDSDLNGEEKQICNTFAIKTTVEIYKLVHGSERTQNILDLLWKFHQSGCSEEKDRFGALYGLIPSSMRPMVNLAAPYLQIYETFAVELAKRSSVQLISHLAHFQPVYSTKGVQAPSWIPDWSRERQQPRLLSCGDTQMVLSAWFHNLFYRKLHFQQTVDYRNDQASWRNFLRPNYQTILQCSRISTYYDNGTEVENSSSEYTKSAVLRIQWFHPIAQRYGMRICAVIAVPTEPEGTRISSAFAQDLQMVAKTLHEQHRLNTFCALIANTSFMDQGYKPNVSDILACFTDMASRTPAQLESSPSHCDTQNLSSGHVVQVLASFLFEQNLAILQWSYGNHSHMYAVGPSTLKAGDRLIPLSNVHSLRAGKPNAFILQADDQSFENLMGVRLHKQESSASARATQHDTEETPVKSTTKESEDQIRPLRATYVGICLSCMPPRGGKFETSDGSVVTDKKHLQILTRGLARHRLAECERADKEEGPPPHVIDIV